MVDTENSDFINKKEHLLWLRENMCCLSYMEITQHKTWHIDF